MPSEGLVTGMPRPRKESAASAMMAPAICVVATTISGERILGRMWRQTMPKLLPPERPPGAHIVLGRLDLGRGARRAGEIGPFGKADDDDQQRHGVAAQGIAAEAGAEQSERDDRHHQGRERELDVGGAGDEAVACRPLIAGEQTERNADRSLDGDGEHADGERDARAVEDGAQEIAALRVGAEQKARIAALAPPGRKLGIEHVEAREIERIVRRDERREQRGKRDHRRAGSRRCTAPGCSTAKSSTRRAAYRSASARSSRALEADAGIEHEAHDVDQRVDDDEEKADGDEIGGDQRDVGAGHRFEKEKAHAGPLEHRLGEQRVGDAACRSAGRRPRRAESARCGAHG